MTRLNLLKGVMRLMQRPRPGLSFQMALSAMPFRCGLYAF